MNNKWNDEVEKATHHAVTSLGSTSHGAPALGKSDLRSNKTIETFEQIGLKEILLRGIYGYGFETPSNIQKTSIPIIKKGQDLIAQSQSGTGKTGAFVCGVLETINEKEAYPQAIIMSPTHELSTQIQSVARDIGKYMKIKTCLCIGGNNVENNVREAKSSHIIIGTPGRIYDVMERKGFDPREILIFCMDEADELLKDEFFAQTKGIISNLHEKTQICVFTATITRDLMDKTEEFMVNPIKILVKQEKLTLDLIAQYYINVEQEKYKLDVLEDLYKNFSIGQCIIYVNYKEKAIRLKAMLTKIGYAVDATHSGLKPIERTEVMKKFRSGNCRVLISTDLLSRGIDVQQVGYVINYDLPSDLESYLHRIGRSGRYGKRGVAINFVTDRDMHKLDVIMAKYKVTIEQMPDPDIVNGYLNGKS